MPINGTFGIIAAENALKNESEASLTKSLDNANEEAIKQDRKDVTKAKGVKND